MEESRQKIAKRLAQTLREIGKPQAEFARIVGVHPTTVNKWVKGKMGLSVYNAREISEKFPDYSPEYLLGLSEFRNEDERELFEREDDIHYGSVVSYCAKELAMINGFDIWPESEEISYDENSPVHTIPRYTLSKGGRKAVLSGAEWGRLCDEIAGYMAFRLDSILERGRW